jgi:hypothetical protein
MIWKRFEIILSWLSIAGLMAVVGYLGYMKFMPKSQTNHDRQLLDFFLSAEESPDGDASNNIIKPNELSEYLVPSSTQSIEIELPLPEFYFSKDEIHSSSTNVN